MKLPVLITLAATLLGFGGLFTFLVATDRDPALLLTSLVIILPTLGALFLGQKAVTQTNGNLASLRAENVALNTEVKQLRTVLTPEQAKTAGTIPVTEASPIDPATGKGYFT